MPEKKVILVRDEDGRVLESFRQVEKLLSRQGLAITLDNIEYQDPDSKIFLKPGEVVFFPKNGDVFYKTSRLARKIGIDVSLEAVAESLRTKRLCSPRQSCGAW